MRKAAPLVAFALLAAACNDTTGPSAATTTTIVAGMNPQQSGVIRFSSRTYPVTFEGAVLPPGSGLVNVDVSTTLAQREPYARLAVYLLTAHGPDHCAHNAPESPVWTDLDAGWSDRRTITGFLVTSLPCEVTGIRAVLHRRRSHQVLQPPTAAETIVETTVPAQLLILPTD